MQERCFSYAILILTTDIIIDISLKKLLRKCIFLSFLPPIKSRVNSSRNPVKSTCSGSPPFLQRTDQSLAEKPAATKVLGLMILTTIFLLFSF